MGIAKISLLAFGAMALAFPALAQEANPAPNETEAQAETLTIPFDPPLGTPLRYAMTFEKKGRRGSPPVTMEQELTFKRMGAGYLLTLKHQTIVVGEFRGDLTNPRILNAMPAGLRPFIMPLTIELNEAGEMVRMHDWDGVRKALRDLPRTLAQLEGDSPDSDASKMVEQVMAPMLNASAEDAPALIIRGWPDVMGFGGVEMEEGEPYEAIGETEDDLALGAVDGSGFMWLTRTDAGHYNFKQTTTYDPESLAQLTRSVQQTFANAGGPAPKEITANDPTKISMIDEINFIFDGKTGLPVSTIANRIVGAEGEGTGGQVTNIKRIDR